MKKEQLQTILESMQGSYHELKGLKFVNSDARLGKRLALAQEGESGTLNVKTDYLTYDEMYRFLQGYAMKADNQLGALVNN